MSLSATNDTGDGRCLVDLHQGGEPYFELPDNVPAWQKVMRQRPHRVVDDTKQCAHEMPMTWGNLKRVYPDAIELGSDKSDGVFWKVFFWFFIVLLVLGVAGLTTFMVFMAIFVIPGFYKLIVIPTFIVSAAGFLVVSIMYRSLPATDMYAAQLFNRKTREVIFVTRTQPRFFKPVERSQPVYKVESWDKMHVRSYKTQIVGQGSYQTMYHLQLIFEDPDNPRFAGSTCAIGGANYSDDYLFQLYEYVRRYMEEGAPPVGPGCVPDVENPPPAPPFKQADIEAAGGRALSNPEILAILDKNDVRVAEDLREALKATT